MATNNKRIDQKTIFVTIPAYNDVSLIKTLEGALENAMYPDNVYFCIGMQYHEEYMPDISAYVNNPKFKFLFYDVDKRPGVYWIRREMADQYSGQDYFLMIDSHMVFNKNWDVLLINDYDGLVAKHGYKTIISRPTMEKVGSTMDNGHVNDYPHWSANLNNDTYSVERTILPWVSNVPWSGEKFIKHNLSCSHFFFTNKNWLSEVGFFQDVRSYSEEMTICVKTFLSGWDYYFVPDFIYIGHDDSETQKALYGKEYTLGQGKRYQALFEDDQLKKEIDLFNLLDMSTKFKVDGQSRSIEDFYDSLGKEVQEAREILIKNLGLDQSQE